MAGRGGRPNALGSNSQRFAQVPGPDGSKVLIPQSRDSITALYLMTKPGVWPDDYDMLMGYIDPSLVVGTTFPLVEMRAGKGAGMGTRQHVRVVDVRFEMERWQGIYVRVKRFVLLEPVIGDELDDFSADNLDGLP